MTAGVVLQWKNRLYMENIFEFLRSYFEYVLIAGGLLFLIGAILDRKWVYRATDGDKARHTFIFEMWGEKGYRVFIEICGLGLVICGLVYLVLS